tara:strand:- start:1597 stop:2064 length:468 start_codon:yes stop_codon:yes gene_type:complete
MSTSPHLLQVMGLKFARSILDKEIDGEQKLWRAVVVNAFDDTLIELSDRKMSLFKISAHNWIIGHSKEFQLVCYWGKLDPDDMKECYVKALKNHNVKFNQRQLMWKKYDNLYKMMLSAEDKFDRKIKRKKVDDFRKEVQNTPTTYVSTVVVSVLV